MDPCYGGEYFLTTPKVDQLQPMYRNLLLSIYFASSGNLYGYRPTTSSLEPNNRRLNRIPTEVIVENIIVPLTAGLQYLFDHHFSVNATFYLSVTFPEYAHNDIQVLWFTYLMFPDPYFSSSIPQVIPFILFQVICSPSF